MSDCKIPGCQHWTRERKVPRQDPNCICGKPLLIVIPPGGHIHCPVHPEHVIQGPGVVTL